jgi:hypothetical protein
MIPRDAFWRDGSKPFFKYVFHNEVNKIFEILKVDRFQVFQYNESWQTPLILAVKHGHKETAKLLISFGADCNWRDIVGRSPLFYAVQNQDVDLVILLIANFSSTFAIDNYGQSLVPQLSPESCIDEVWQSERNIKMQNFNSDQPSKKTLWYERAEHRFPKDVKIPNFEHFDKFKYVGRKFTGHDMIYLLVKRGQHYQVINNFKTIQLFMLQKSNKGNFKQKSLREKLALKKRIGDILKNQIENEGTDGAEIEERFMQEGLAFFD